MNKDEQERKNEQELDTYIRQTMQKKSRLPDEVQRAKEQAFAKIKEQQKNEKDTWQTDEKKCKSISSVKKKTLWKRWAGAAAAAVIAFSCICIANPVLAENIPVIGHVFEMISNKIQFGGDFSSYAEPVQLESTADMQDESDDAENAHENYKTIGDATITLDEAYCNGKYLYISMILKSKEKLTEGAGLTAVSKVYLRGTMYFSYADSYDILQDDMEGKLLDEYTYAGMFRHDLSETLLDQYNEERVDDTGDKMIVPDDFTVRIYIGGVYGIFMGSDGSWSGKNEVAFRGPWEYKMDVSVNRDNVTEAVINQDEKQDFKSITLVKTPFEIIAEWELDRDTDSSHADYDIVLLDADGLPLSIGQNLDDFSISGHDVSEVTAYIVPDQEYFDSVKSYTYSGEDLPENMTLAELLEQKAVYSEKVTFE